MCKRLSRILIYYRYDQYGDRWFRGDARLRAPIRRLLRGPDKIGGIDLVYLNLCAGLDRLGVEFHTNIPFAEIRAGDKVGVIGRGRESLEGYRADNPILAGVAVAAHPAEWPTLFEDYPVSRYVVHCDWVKAMYERTWRGRVVTWAVGIDTDTWRPTPDAQKSVDILIYDKVRWDKERVHRAMVDPIRAVLEDKGLTTETIRYGAYDPGALRAALARSRAFLFLCEHETQGLAYQQAMSAGLPVLAWDPGQWLDPWRYRYGDIHVPATSVPFFDQRCGLTFHSAADFEMQLDSFISMLNAGAFNPRAYVDEKLSLEVCARHYIQLLNEYS